MPPLREGESGWVIVDGAGNTIASTRDPDEALAIAQQTPFHLWLAPTPAEVEAREGRRRGSRVANPPVYAGDQDAVDTSPYDALTEAGLPLYIDEGEVMAMSEKEAWALIKPAWDQSVAITRAYRLSRGEKTPVHRKKLASITKPRGQMLADNEKMKHRDPRHPYWTQALGLSLVPESTAFKGATDSIQAPVSFRAMGFDPIVSPATWMPPKKSLCAGSSTECRRTCLVYSGQNQSEEAANHAKYTRTKTLIEHPVAFMRLMHSALLKYASADSKAVPGERVKFARLNVFSDIPWEYMVPWLFVPTRYPTMRRGEFLRFYDYTKVPLRNGNYQVPGDRLRSGYGHTIPNYDLSFSYSGRNLRLCNQEFQNGRRVVMVFAAPQYKLFGAMDRKIKSNVLPRWMRDPGFAGGADVEVVDGDVSDVRPFDPSDVVVGLRFKAPHPKVDPVSAWPALDSRFVIWGDAVRGMGTKGSSQLWFRLPETPLSQPGEAANREKREYERAMYLKRERIVSAEIAARIARRKKDPRRIQREAEQAARDLASRGGFGL